QLAESARLLQLGEAPFRRHPIGGDRQNDGMAARQLLVEPLLPVLARPDPGFLVEIEEDAVEAEPRHRRLDIVRDLGFAARMTDENRGHRLASSLPHAAPTRRRA